MFLESKLFETRSNDFWDQESSFEFSIHRDDIIDSTMEVSTMEDRNANIFGTRIIFHRLKINSEYLNINARQNL